MKNKLIIAAITTLAIAIISCATLFSINLSPAKAGNEITTEYLGDLIDSSRNSVYIRYGGFYVYAGERWLIFGVGDYWVGTTMVHVKADAGETIHICEWTYAVVEIGNDYIKLQHY